MPRFAILRPRLALTLAMGVLPAGAFAGCGANTAPAESSGLRTGLDLGWTLDECLGRGDSDRDGLSDACELELARAFAPELVVAPSSCDWDTSVSPARLGGEYYFGVAPGHRPGEVRIAYLPAYYSDCGWQGRKCWLPGAGCEGHAGDSEMVALSVIEAGGRWSLSELFLSAHCFSRTGSCAWKSVADLDGLEWVGSRAGGAPRVLVAEGTHAAYPSRTACDRGHHFMDTCDRNDQIQRYPIRSNAQNVGSRVSPVGSTGGCVGPDHVGWGSEQPDPGTVECFWSGDAPFRGWQAEGQGEAPTPYDRYLREVLAW